jgi:hypothetical protein
LFLEFGCDCSEFGFGVPWLLLHCWMVILF